MNSAFRAGESKASGSLSDPFFVREFYQPLRVADVADALDGIGYFNIGLVSQEIRPLWLGMRFWGVAYTLRCVPSNKPMWKLDTTEDVVNAHGVWFKAIGNPISGFHENVRPGHVVVTDVGSADNVGFWGSENTLGLVAKGAVGIVTNGQCRDTGEVTMQKTPVACKSRGRTIIPGRIEGVETQVPIGIGGAQVRPGDIVGCDDDGLVVVPIEVAHEVSKHARAVLVADMKSRNRRYAVLDMAQDESTDHDAIGRYYADLENRIVA